MLSRYGIFCRAVETGSFTRVAEQVGYTQSAVSQTIKGLEQEMGTVLIDRRRGGVTLTKDGAQVYPFIQAIHRAEQALAQKQRELQGLKNSTVVIGTFTGVSRDLLPRLMKDFRAQHPQVHFELRQGDYTSISRWVREGAVDFGFVHADAAQGVETRPLCQDELMAVLPPSHPLTTCDEVSLAQLAGEPFILLDEGDHSVPLMAFSRHTLAPSIEYKVYDDYSILAMVRQGLGVSVMYRRVLTGFEEGLCIRPIRERPRRTIALAWHHWETMPYAARQFAEFVAAHTTE